MEEIKTELRQENIAVKANAVTKLAYVSITFTHTVIVWRATILRPIISIHAKTGLGAQGIIIVSFCCVCFVVAPNDRV